MASQCALPEVALPAQSESPLSVQEPISAISVSADDKAQAVSPLSAAFSPASSASVVLELGPDKVGSLGASCLSSGLSYSFFSFDSNSDDSLCQDDRYHALMRCAFAGVVSVVLAQVLDLEAGLQGDRMLYRVVQLLTAVFLGGGHVLLLMHAQSHLWTQLSFARAPGVIDSSSFVQVRVGFPRGTFAGLIFGVLPTLGWLMSACRLRLTFFGFCS